jgi:membrane-associated protease RseP (regulator of RpoE activity)
MKALETSSRARVRNAIAAPRLRPGTMLWSFCAAAVLAHAAEANIPRPSAPSRPGLTHLAAAAPAMRREPSSRHEPAMLDKLEGAELENTREGAQPAGVVVVSVRFASAMLRNGLRPGDVIVAVERDRVGSLHELRRALAKVAWPFVVEIARDGRRVLIVVP